MKNTELIIKHLTRKQYIEAMINTEFGSKKSEKFPCVGCPSDVFGVSIEDEPYKGECHTTCKECWEYVLKNKNW